MTIRAGIIAGAFGILAAFSLNASRAQEDTPQRAASAGGLLELEGGKNAENWYIYKTKGGVYQEPNRPIWRLADLLRMHKGQNNWSQPILKDQLQDVTYNSAAPGTKAIPRMHIETASVYVVMRGQVRFNVEGQQPVVATRGSVVNILNDTIYSYEVLGSENALWININPLFYGTEYPSNEPPPPARKGADIVTVKFAHKAQAYTGNNRLHFNLFESLAKCEPVRGAVNDDHIYLSPNVSFVNPADNKCPGGRANAGADAGERASGPFNPRSTFGHLHLGNREWWIVQAGAIDAKFENIGELHAVEGDVLDAAPMMWHQMAGEAPSGPSVRTATGGYVFINMASVLPGGASAP